MSQGPVAYRIRNQLVPESGQGPDSPGVRRDQFVYESGLRTSWFQSEGPLSLRVSNPMVLELGETGWSLSQGPVDLGGGGALTELHF